MCSSTSAATTPLSTSQSILALDEKMAAVFKAEQTGKASLISNAILECCIKYPEVTLQDIENRFRQKKSSTCLIAVIDRSMPGTPMLNGARKTHTLRVATRYISAVLRELYNYCLTYDESFKNLAEAGINTIFGADYPKEWSDEQVIAHIRSNLDPRYFPKNDQDEFKA